ncbi:EVE domain-containing protein [Geoalkalibacter halelectricus]|uniref:EVE domain-containing protein n=1 Tax=Geoalkalibacter halelectricus TaxID=2847045 RepID=A0ABY5ZUI6_9BACT|nr:EVE domain-containing protein [Geoalkalibacter halelectricus]UWZ81595.1 EVE domain-containing protein [Geoalkalibacter halelectricus]
MKSEPQCFSFADLKRAPGQITCWDGVRNYQARNLLRDEVRIGDGVLFYHSSIPVPAIVGLARVMRAGYPDPSARDPRSEHFDPRAGDENPIWWAVDIQYDTEIVRPLTREMLRGHPVLEKMDVLRKGNRLSVQPVTAEQWEAVLQLSQVRDQSTYQTSRGRV